MVKRARIRRAIGFEYTFDRLFATKLEQAYEILNPDQVRILRTGADVMGVGDEGRCNLRPGIVGLRGLPPIDFLACSGVDGPKTWVGQRRVDCLNKRPRFCGFALISTLTASLRSATLHTGLIEATSVRPSINRRGKVYHELGTARCQRRKVYRSL